VKKKYADGGGVDSAGMAQMAGDAAAAQDAQNVMTTPPMTPQQKQKLLMLQAAKRKAMMQKQQQAEQDTRMNDVPPGANYDQGQMQRAEQGYKKGGKVHDDAAQDKKMIKSMIKPSALKKADGGMAQKVQMAKSNAIEASMKGQKKTGYADGGDIALAAPRMTSPLQAMAARTRSVPVAPRNPMIPQQAAMPAMQAAAPGGARIGVGRARAGKPNVGAIRAAMARSVTQAMPESAPSMMKKGGKVKC
jgi:hypothetical protein